MTAMTSSLNCPTSSVISALLVSVSWNLKTLSGDASVQPRETCRDRALYFSMAGAGNNRDVALDLVEEVGECAGGLGFIREGPLDDDVLAGIA